MKRSPVEAEYILTRFPGAVRRLATLQPTNRNDPVPPGYAWLWSQVLERAHAETGHLQIDIADALHLAICEWDTARDQALEEECGSSESEAA